MSMDSQQSSAETGRRVLAFLPLTVAAALAIVLAWGLTQDPSGDLKGEVSLVNVFASWCVACREEHPLFMYLAAQGTVPLYGLNYKDQPDDAAQWLDSLGDSYTRTGADISGNVAIDWGVYGVPETFVVGADGLIAYKHIGPVNEEVLAETILPLVEPLRQRTADRDKQEVGL